MVKRVSRGKEKKKNGRSKGRRENTTGGLKVENEKKERKKEGRKEQK